MQQTLEALVVDNQCTRLAVVERVFHFWWSPPCVHAHNRGADGHRGPVAHDPLGVVAHRNSNACTGLYAVGQQVRSQLAHLTLDLTVGVALVFVDEVVLVGITSSGFPQRAHRWRGRDKRLRRHPADIDDGGSKRRAGSIEFGAGGEVMVDHPASLADSRSPTFSQRRNRHVAHAAGAATESASGTQGTRQRYCFGGQ